MRSEFSNPMDEMVQFKRYTAEAVQFALGVAMPANTDIQVAAKDYGIKLGAAFKMWLYGCEIREDIRTRESVPVGAWDHLKLAMPSWLRRFFKAPKMREIATVVKHWHLCPHIAVPDQQPHFDFMVFDYDQRRP